MQYAYDSQNKRIWKGMFDGNGYLTGQELYFYGVDGQKLGTYTLMSDYGQNRQTVLWDPTPTLAVFFGAKRVAVGGVVFVPDRLGSKGKYYPYGEERNSPPLANDQVKFATYTRDSSTGLDYADQRYYAANFGRFMSADPYQASAGPGDPATWNRYTYTRSDPVNRTDRRGRCDEDPPPFEAFGADACDPEPQAPPVPGTPKGGDHPGTGGTAGSANAIQGFRTIANRSFEQKQKCADFFAELIKENNLNIDVKTLMDKVASQAGEIADTGFVYNGVGDSTPLDPDKFPGAAGPGVQTVGDIFKNPGTQGYSQFNGVAVWFRLDDWYGITSPFTSLFDGPNAYGLGTLMHEILHKFAVGGGFTHIPGAPQIENALRGINAYYPSLGGNDISNSLAKICF